MLQQKPQTNFYRNQNTSDYGGLPPNTATDRGMSTDDEKTTGRAQDFEEYQYQNKNFASKDTSPFYKTVTGTSPKGTGLKSRIMSKWNHAFASNYAVSKSPKKQQ